MAKQRLEWADVARGIGIILVVFAHTLIPSLRDNSAAVKFLWIFIYDFHMPLFFFISGWLFEKNIERYTKRMTFIVGKARMLMLPYVVFSVFAYALIFLATKSEALAGILSGGGYAAAGAREAVFSILTYSGHIDKHLWFVYSLFIVFVVNICFKRTMRSLPALIVTLVLYVSKAYVKYPAILDYTAADLFFFSLARVIFSKHEKKAAALSRRAVLLAAAIFTVTNCIYGFFYVTHMPDGVVKGVLYVVRALCSVCGITTVCGLSAYLSASRARGFFAALGTYSYDIYLMHAPFLVSGLMGILLSRSSVPPILCCFTVTVIGIAVPYVFSRRVVRKIPLLSFVILGKKLK